MATLFVENLTVADFSYLHPKRGMVGESWHVDLELSGELDQQGMVFDFGHIKKQIKHTIDDHVDHRLLIPADSDLIEHNERNDSISIEWQYPAGRIRMVAPEESVLLLPCTEISKANLTLHLMALIRDVVPDNVSEVRVFLREEHTGTSPYYHYSHGLKKHDGNCQRIAHGHRSAIQIFENGRRSRYWEKLWADRWEDIYIGTQEDLEGTYFIDETPHHLQRFYIVLEGTIADARHRRVCRRTTEFLGRDLLVGHGLHNVGARDEHVRRVLNHEDEIGHGG